jgi:predicted DNA-binding transcriptional regulator AlpA
MNLLDYKEVAKKLSIHPRSVYTFKNEEPTFPSPVRLSNKRVRWVEAEVDDWIKTKKGDVNDHRNSGKETLS